MDAKEAEALLRGQQSLYQYMLGFADSMALKCAVDLRLADIIHSRGRPMALHQIAESITSSVSPDIASLTRIMRLLVCRDIFAAHQPLEGGDTLYGLTYTSRWLVTESESSNLVPMVAMFTHPLMLGPWHHLAQCVKEGGMPFEKAYGMGSWEMASKNPEYNKLFNDAMECGTKTITQAILGSYGDGFGCIRSLVDVGGGTGTLISEIVRANPHVRGINFDLPHVVATAPVHPGVEHVSGSMFESIPSADAIFLKLILHDWGDEDCIKILKNCKKAIPEERGKLIIVDVVLQPEGDELLGDVHVVSDIIMLVNTGGKERTELEWKKLLAEGGFPRYNIIKMPALHSIIEAYPN